MVFKGQNDSFEGFHSLVMTVWHCLPVLFSSTELLWMPSILCSFSSVILSYLSFNQEGITNSKHIFSSIKVAIEKKKK